MVHVDGCYVQMQHAASISAEEQTIKMAQQYAAIAAGVETGGPEKLWDIALDYTLMYSTLYIIFTFISFSFAHHASVSVSFHQWLRKGTKGACARAALCRGRHLERRKYEILKFGRFWRIGVCIADSDILRVSYFCIKLGNSAWNLVIWFSGKSLNLSHIHYKCKITAVYTNVNGDM